MKELEKKVYEEALTLIGCAKSRQPLYNFIRDYGTWQNRYRNLEFDKLLQKVARTAFNWKTDAAGKTLPNSDNLQREKEVTE